MRCFSPSLPLLALVLLGMPGCSSTGDSLEPTPIPPRGDGYDDAGVAEGDESTSGEDTDPGDDTGSADDGPVEPAPEPDDGGRSDVPDEPEAACDLESDVALWIAPDDSNAMASPVLAREAVLGGWGSVRSVAIRTWEFFNYYDFGYPPAEPGMLAVNAALLQPEGAPAGELVLQVGVSSEALDPGLRPPMDVTLVLDTSGSMEGEAMEVLRETCTAIAASLAAGDVVSIVTWSSEGAVVLGHHAVEGPDDPAVLAAIDGLTAGGENDLHAGLQAGYALAQATLASGRASRVVLVSDGSVNADVADLELIAQHAGTGPDGIVLVGVGVGDAATYRDDLVDAATDAGKGAAVFVASPADAWSTFHDRFVSTMTVAARDVQVRLDMPPGFSLVSAGTGTPSLDMAELEPQHLAADDAPVLHQRGRTCAPTELSSDASVTVTAIWIDAVTHKPRQVQRAATMAELLAADPAPILKGAAVLAYAEGLKAHKQADADGRAQTMSGAFEALARAEAVLPEDTELAEIRQVLEALTE